MDSKSFKTNCHKDFTNTWMGRGLDHIYPYTYHAHQYTNFIKIKKCVNLYGCNALAKSKAKVLANHDSHIYKQLAGLGDPYYANYTICIAANCRHVTTCLFR